jgi:hypothetical protein
LLVARNNMITINKVVVLFCVILSYQI